MFQTILDELARLNLANLYGGDFLQTHDKTEQEIGSVFAVADALRDLHQRGISAKLFDSGLALALLRDGSARSRVPFAAGCGLLGLTVREADGGPARETAGVLSALADVVGIQSGLSAGDAAAYLQETAEAVRGAQAAGGAERGGVLINLGCDLDNPARSMADFLHLIHQFGGVEKLPGRKIAVTWAHSAACDTPGAEPQGMLSLATRFGMEVCLAHPEGYGLMPEAERIAAEHALRSGGSFRKTDSMDDAFRGADIVYPVSWAPLSAAQKPSGTYAAPGGAEMPARPPLYRDWTCSEERMALTRDALYLHGLPVEVSGVTCPEGEVDAAVFARFRDRLYVQASYQPYLIAAMVVLARAKDPVAVLRGLNKRNRPRILL